MPLSPIHLLTAPGQLAQATVVCGARDAALGTWDPHKVTCPACSRVAARDGQRGAYAEPGSAHRGRPTSTPPLHTEKQFQEALRQHAVTAGWLYFHVADSRKSPPGFPDTALVKDSILLLAELKMPGKGPTPPQQMWLDALGQVTQVMTRVWRPEDWGEIREVVR